MQATDLTTQGTERTNEEAWKAGRESGRRVSTNEMTLGRMTRPGDKAASLLIHVNKKDDVQDYVGNSIQNSGSIYI